MTNTEIRFKDLSLQLEFYKITERTFRYYQTKGLVPGPIRTTREEGAVYNREQVFLYLDTIQLLKEQYNKTIDVIYRIFDNYKTEMENLTSILRMTWDEYGGQKAFSNYDEQRYYQEACRCVRNSLIADLLRGKSLSEIDPIAYVSKPKTWFVPE